MVSVPLQGLIVVDTARCPMFVHLCVCCWSQYALCGMLYAWHAMLSVMSVSVLLLDMPPARSSGSVRNTASLIYQDQAIQTRDMAVPKGPTASHILVELGP